MSQHPTFNWKKQIGDQSLHVFIGALFVYLFAVIFGDAWIAAVGVSVAWIWREYEQWPSARWWDPILDWIFEAAGVWLGVWLYL